MSYNFEKLVLYLNSISSFTTITLCIISLLFIYDKWKKDNINKVYNEIAAAQFIFGLISGIVNCIARMEVIIDGSCGIIYLYHFKELGKKINIIVIFIAMTCLYINIAMPAAIMVSRNLVIVKKKILETRHTFFLLSVTFFFVIELALAITLCYNYDNNGNLLYNISMTKTIFIDDISSKFYCPGCEIISPYGFIVVLSIMLFFSANYIIFFFQYKSYNKYIKQYSETMTMKTKKMNNEFLKILYLQNLTPVLITGLPTLVLIASIFLKFDIIIFTGSTYLILFINFVPAINAIFFIFLPSGNRRKIKNFVRFFYYKNKQNNVRTLNFQTTRI
uniref:G-protein coupled receptors family 1 profile domain-containing protein n=1 Tax=Strongyloides stercoralis TaxID=6248 RepID=A0A0K0DWQ0_STRER